MVDLLQLLYQKLHVSPPFRYPDGMKSRVLSFQADSKRRKREGLGGPSGAIGL